MRELCCEISDIWNDSIIMTDKFRLTSPGLCPHIKKTMAPEESENKFSCYNFFELFYGTNLKFISGIKINNNNFKVYYILNYFLII